MDFPGTRDNCWLYVLALPSILIHTISDKSIIVDDSIIPFLSEEHARDLDFSLLILCSFLFFPHFTQGGSLVARSVVFDVERVGSKQVPHD